MLFSLSIFYRGLDAKTPGGSPHVWVPFGRDDAGSEEAKNPLSSSAELVGEAHHSEPVAAYGATRVGAGDPEIGGTAIRLMLLGSRGFVITYLWHEAIDKQKRNDFHEFDLNVKSITTLQPNFITPWIFQSWNIAYNISVEMHSLGDMYFYIARGIELLAEGERRNNRSPDIRYSLAFYYMNKFGVSDQVQTLRCLLQLSCIPKAERDPERFYVVGTRTIDRAVFRDFCEKHPQLVRRLRGEERREPSKKDVTFEPLAARTPEDIVDFLRANKDLPSRYKNATELADADKQFPVLPARFNEGAGEFNPSSESTEDLSGYLAARAWYTYANVLVPPAAQLDGKPIPSGAPRPGNGPNEYDPFKYRVPRSPMLIIFKHGPARAQSYQAEMMDKDGWFDRQGWEIDGNVDEAKAWFTDPLLGVDGREIGRKKLNLKVGEGTDWSRSAWEKAALMWRKYGEENGLILPSNFMEQLRELAGLKRYSEMDFIPMPLELSEDQKKDETLYRQYTATSALHFYNQNRQVTNFPSFLASSETEQKEETVQARKKLWMADQARRAGNKQEAIKMYEQGLAMWKQVLIDNEAFHRGSRSDLAEEQTCEYELEYLRLISQDDERVRLKAQEEYAKLVGNVSLLTPFMAGVTPKIPSAAVVDWNFIIAEKFFAPKFAFGGLMPTDLPDSRAGSPWVRKETREVVLGRQGIKAPEAPSNTPEASGQQK